MSVKKNNTSMSDMSDYLPKSLCKVSDNNNFNEHDSSVSFLISKLENTKSLEHESVLEDSRKTPSQLKRVKYFLEQHKTLKPWLKDIIITSGILKLYEDKYRKLMFEHGTSKHPFPEERL